MGSPASLHIHENGMTQGFGPCVGTGVLLLGTAVLLGTVYN